jgi:hypothetical protein
MKSESNHDPKRQPAKPSRQPDSKSGWRRREFVSTLAGAAAGVFLPSLATGCATRSPSGRGAGGRRLRVAFLATEVRRHSHAQHFIDRFLEGYGWEGRWHRPEVDLAALYVDQFPEGDLSRDRSARFNVPIYPTLEEALTMGTSKLAVDGVVIIGEHGKYPRNEKGQTRYPRYEWFKRVVKIFEQSDRTVPVFNDKHLSTTWPECLEMVNEAKRLGFVFSAGSSLPVTWRIPSIDLPLGTDLRESLCVCYGGVDSYDFHGLETAQCMSERRTGGESGIRSMQALKGERLWNYIGENELTQRLLFAALARSHTLRVPDGYAVPPPTLDWVRRGSPQAIGYFFEHNDGLRTSMLLCNGLVQDFTYAGIDRKGGRPISCQMHLPMPNHISTTADFFNPLMHHVERMIIENRAPYPVERTLLTSGMTLFGVESLHRGQTAINTPEMNITYRPTAGSTFWRA